MLRVYVAPHCGNGHGAVRALLARAYGRCVGGALPTLRKTAAGKPYLEGSAVEISLAHSKTLVACALSDQGPVGVDVEDLRPLRPGLAERVLAESELLQLDRATDRAQAFFALWTQKEALAKQQSCGLGGRPREFVPAASGLRFQTVPVGGGLLTLCAPPGECPLPQPEWCPETDEKL